MKLPTKALIKNILIDSDGFLCDTGSDLYQLKDGK